MPRTQTSKEFHRVDGKIQGGPRDVVGVGCAGLLSGELRVASPLRSVGLPVLKIPDVMFH